MADKRFPGYEWPTCNEDGCTKRVKKVSVHTLDKCPTHYKAQAQAQADAGKQANSPEYRRFAAAFGI